MAQSIYNAVLTFPHLPTPFYGLNITYTEEYLLKISFITTEAESVDTHEPPYFDIISQQLTAYFGCPARTPDLTCAPPDSYFQGRVRQALSRIKPGETATYQAVAKTMRTSPRAVAAACRANPLPIIVPCHRIVGKHDLGGYCGQKQGRQMDIKRWLLSHEQQGMVL